MSKQMDESQLLESARKGDRDAFRRLVLANSRPMHQLAWRIMGDPDIAEDVVQEAMLKAHQQLDKFDQRSKFSTWLYRITTNTAIDMKRKNKRFDEYDSMTDLESYSKPQRAERDMIDKQDELKQATNDVMDQLTVQERTAFSLKHYDGLSIAEICDILAVSESAVKQAIFRAVKKLREQLTPLLNEPTAQD